jgi:LuxR family transcriptional regulator of csgAB operon
MPSEDKENNRPHPRSIHIIGPQRLQNRLFADFLAQHSDFVCSEAETFAEALKMDASGRHPKLFLRDCQGIQIDDLFFEFQQQKDTVIDQHYLALFNVSPSFGNENKSVDLGIRGFFYTQDSPEHILKGIKAIVDDELWVSREILTKCVIDNRTNNNPLKTEKNLLTAREIEILTLIVPGATNEEISDILNISPHTVRTHIYNIFKKIDVPNRLQATLWAIQYL